MNAPDPLPPSTMQAEVGALCEAARRGEAPIYGLLLHENVLDALSATFPEACERLGPERLHALVAAFMADHGALDPQFHRIAAEFVAFLQARPDVPAELLALLEYEWLQLAVEIDAASVPAASRREQGPGDLAFTLNPTARLVLLPFDLARENAFETACDARLPYVVYRTADHRVVTRPLTRQDCLLIEIIRETPVLTCDRLAGALGDAWPGDALRGWAADALDRGLLSPYLPDRRSSNP